jgi:aspartyl-tRNA(Asn)/glutamyl-tRNA(Gln) amidotransferase subunit C
MTISKKDVEYVANLSRLKIPSGQIGHFTSQLADIISYIDKLKEVDLKGVQPTSHPLPLKNVFRKDEVKKSLDVEKALSTAPQKKKDFFKVPKVIEES